MPPRISVIVPIYNAASTLRAAVQSILTQDIAGLAVLLLAPQTAGTQTLRHALKLLQPWLLAPGAALLLALVPGAILCQRRRSA